MTNYAEQRYTIVSNLGEMKCNILELNDEKAKITFKTWLSKKCEDMIKRDKRFGTKITKCELVNSKDEAIMTAEILLNVNGKPYYNITQEV